MNKPLDPEILSDDDASDLPAPLDLADASLAVGLSRAEIDTQISTARRFPRNLTQVRARLLSLVTLDEETAEECMYALPRGGKPIKGPSIRFAEALQSAYGNCRTAARVVFVDRVEKVVIAEGIFHDLETNAAKRGEVRRRIVDKKGRLFNDDMIAVTGNAAGSIALRNAILGGIPKAVWRAAYGEALKVIAGDVKTLSENRGKALKAFAQFGITPEQVFTALGVAGELDITLDLMPTLRGMYATLKNGESTVEEMFGGVKGRSDHATVKDPLADDVVDEETGEVITQSEAQPPETGEPARPATKGDEPTASAQATSTDAAGAAKVSDPEPPPQPSTEPAPGPQPAPVAAGTTSPPPPPPETPAVQGAGSKQGPTSSTPLPMLSDVELAEHVLKALAGTLTIEDYRAAWVGLEREVRSRNQVALHAIISLARSQRERAAGQMSADDAREHGEDLIAKLREATVGKA